MWVRFSLALSNLYLTERRKDRLVLRQFYRKPRLKKSLVLIHSSDVIHFAFWQYSKWCQFAFLLFRWIGVSGIREKAIPKEWESGGVGGYDERERDCEGKERTLSVFWGRPINLPRAGFKFPQTVVAAHILSVRVFVQPLLSLSLFVHPRQLLLLLFWRTCFTYHKI